MMEENSQQARKAQPVQNMSETIWVEECLRRLRSPRIANPDESGPADAPPVSSLAMELQSCRYENYKYDDRGVEIFSRKQRGKFGGQLFRRCGTQPVASGIDITQAHPGIPPNCAGDR